MPENKSNKGEFRNDESGSDLKLTQEQLQKIIEESKKK